MSNFEKAVEVLRESYREPSLSPVHACNIMADALEAAGLLAPDVQVITTPEELEALELDDPDAIAVAGEAGAVRSVRALAAIYRLGSNWGLPIVVIASGKQVRAAREEMELDNG
ncbi:MAG: hypothetical protein L0J62_10450 [Corynebacterium casei]|uniref:hypothetical protein n=1 Tax=Corynebacterium casei TaxID=160386 RepID=UPI0026494065|nr:hypothetical protein [Corynebacterium casei]MDN6286094.1 hypothetical protein [Corynebacterium casei]